MKKPGETLRANFGQEPFAFDIDKMVQDEKAAIQENINRTSFTPSAASAPDETQFIHRLISQYLAHDGYVETAQAFAEEIVDEARALANDDDATIPYEEAVEDMDALNRQSTFALLPRCEMLILVRNTRSYPRRRHRQSAQAHPSLLPLSTPRQRKYLLQAAVPEIYRDDSRL